MISRRRAPRSSPTSGDSASLPEKVAAPDSASSPANRGTLRRVKSKQALIKQRPPIGYIGLLLSIPFLVRWANRSERNNTRGGRITEPVPPRMLQLFLAPVDDEKTDTIILNATKLPLYLELPDMTHRDNLYWREGEVTKLRYPDDMRTRPTCDYVSDWQLAYHPSCNAIHEVDLRSFPIINNGAFRDVWQIADSGSGKPRVLKTLRYIDRREFDLRNFDRHRRDAMAFEQLASSKFVVDIYGHCGNSAFFDYCNGGNLYDLFEYDDDEEEGEGGEEGEGNAAAIATTKKPPPSPKRILEIAHQVAQSVADAHHVDAQGRATIAHTDIKPDQWILASDKETHYRLSDFNRARFVTWDSEAKEVCPFRVGKNVGKWRSPEEYSYEDETEKVDVWSLGNVLYFLMTGGRTPYQDVDSSEAMNSVAQGEPPEYPDQYMRDPFYSPIIRAMELCYVLNPRQRGTAQEVANVLRDALLKKTLQSEGATAREAAEVQAAVERLRKMAPR